MKKLTMKFQATISTELNDKVEEELKKNYQTKSAWLTMVISDYFKNQGANKKGKQTIKLDI
jgi:hypothetical protein